MLKEIAVHTRKKQEIIDISGMVQEVISDSIVKNGLCVVYVPHATAAVMVNENADPNIQTDTIDALSALIPEGKWRHDRVDGNAAAHIKASIVGPSETIVIEGGKLVLGTWQSIMLADFDGPRVRTVLVKIIPDREGT